MKITYTILNPLFQVLTNFTEKLEQGVSHQALMDYMGETLRSWQPDEELRSMSQPLRVMTGVRTSSIPPTSHALGAEIIDDPNAIDTADDVRPEHVLQFMRITADRIRATISADDNRSLEELDSLAARWTALSFTMTPNFAVSKLLGSEPPRTDSQREISASLIKVAPLFFLLQSVINELDDQAGIFAFDAQEKNPAQILKLMMVNQQTLEVSGFADGYLTGPGGFLDEIHLDDRPKLGMALQQAISDGHGQIEDLRMKAFRDGRNIWLIADVKIIMPLGLMGGKRVGFFRITNVRDTGAVIDDDDN